MVSEATRTPTLLIVDDEEQILSALNRALRRESFVIETARSPEEALAIVRHSKVDVILSDQKMPGMSGLEMLAKVRAQQPEVICFLITGWAESVPEEDLAAVGVRELFAKPWDGRVLKQRLREVRKELDLSQ